MQILLSHAAEDLSRTPNPKALDVLQWHIHSHRHTHVGVGAGHPMHSAAYGGEYFFK